MDEAISGVIPVAPTVFDEHENLDLAGQRRVVDYLLVGQADGVCVLANYSEQFSLTDSEREEVIAATLEQASGKLPVVVTTSHYSARVANQRCLRAQHQGASMVMLMAPFVGATMTVEWEQVIEYFKRVADGLDIPIMIQDAPMSPTRFPVWLLTRLVTEIEQICYVKIETSQAAGKLRALIDSVGDRLPGPFDGEEAITLIPDLKAGACGTMSSCLVPDRLGYIVREFHAGREDIAIEAWEDILPLIHFENRQCGLRATKVLMKEGGLIANDTTRSPLGPLPAGTRRQLVKLAERKEALIMRWS